MPLLHNTSRCQRNASIVIGRYRVRIDSLQSICVTQMHGHNRRVIAGSASSASTYSIRGSIRVNWTEAATSYESDIGRFRLNCHGTTRNTELHLTWRSQAFPHYPSRHLKWEEIERFNISDYSVCKQRYSWPTFRRPFRRRIRRCGNWRIKFSTCEQDAVDCHMGASRSI